jgi:carboxylate-amine ligase
VKANFCGPSYTLGIEEELMILDPRDWGLTNGIQTLLEETGDEEHIKPELLESVLEIATSPAQDIREAGEMLRRLRATVRTAAERRGLAIGSAGTHPFALWEDQRVTQRERYRELVATLHFVARRELIFGLHVHVGVDSAEKAIHVANGMREHIALLLALSANSPFWRARHTGLASARMPIFRAFPRVGLPPAYAGWEDFESRIDFLIEARAIEDYTWMWYDVRPHPNFGTVEVRAMDAQTRIEHTLGLAALIQALVRELSEHYEADGELPRVPDEAIDANRWLAARFGLEGELIDLPSTKRVPARELAGRLVERAVPHARALGAEAELDGVRDLIEHGTGAQRQRLIYDANEDFGDLLREIVDATAPEVR